MQTVKIDRNKWRRGNLPTDSEPTMLLNEKGNMCCLGFILKQLNDIDDYDILDCPSPNELCNTLKNKLESSPLIDWDFYESSGDISNSILSERAIDINDNSKTITESERESKLTKLFASNNINLIFEN